MGKWSAQQLKFMMWECLTQQERQHKSQHQFAEALGVHENSLCNWKKIPGWEEAKDKVAWLVLEKLNYLTLQRTRYLLRTTPELRDINDYYKHTYPLIAKARAQGYFDDVELDKEGTAMLPEAIVRERLNELPEEMQVEFIRLLEHLDYLKSKEAVVEAEGTDLLSGLIAEDLMELPIVNNRPGKGRAFKALRSGTVARKEDSTAPRKLRRINGATRLRDIEL